MKKRVLLCLGAALSVWGARAEGWEEVKISGRTFVTVVSFCEHYGLPVPAFPDQGAVVTEGNGRSVEWEMGSRDIRIDGVRTWLSFGLRRDPETGRAILPKVDVECLFEVWWRTGEAVPRREVKGVVVDPGHGGADQGAQSRTGCREKEATLATAKHLVELLKAAGIPYVLTRDRDVFVDLHERARIANRHPDYVFISLHYNSAPASAHGVETYAMTPRGASSTVDEGRVRVWDLQAYPGNRLDGNNHLLTALIHREMIRMHSREGDRGVKRARFVVLRECRLPGTLVEGGFLTHVADRKLIAADGYRQKVAAAVFEGLKSYMELMKGKTREPAPMVPKPEATPKAEAVPQSGAAPRKEADPKPEVAPKPPVPAGNATAVAAPETGNRTVDAPATATPPPAPPVEAKPDEKEILDMEQKLIGQVKESLKRPVYRSPSGDTRPEEARP